MNEEGLATASYIGNLSYSWTGSSGQPTPDNWAIDQFQGDNAAFIDDDGNGAYQLIRNPESNRLWYSETD
jgi:hypothetical protein